MTERIARERKLETPKTPSKEPAPIVMRTGPSLARTRTVVPGIAGVGRIQRSGSPQAALDVNTTSHHVDGATRIQRSTVGAPRSFASADTGSTSRNEPQPQVLRTSDVPRMRSAAVIARTGATVQRVVGASTTTGAKKSGNRRRGPRRRKKAAARIAEPATPIAALDEPPTVPTIDDSVTTTGEIEVDAEVEQTPTVDPLVEQRAGLLADLAAAEKNMNGIRAAATRALRARMPRGFLETSSEIDRIVKGLPPKEIFAQYRTKIESLAPNEVRGAEGAVAKVVEAYSDASVERRADWWAGVLNDLTFQKVSDLADAATDADGKKALRNYLVLKYDKQLDVGPLRAYYRSSHDREENATYGMSFDLSNSPLSVHCHTAGSGTQITSVSLKHRDREYGSAVLSESWLEATLAGKLVNGIGRSAENPRAVILDIRAGRRNSTRWTRPGVR